MSASAAPGVIVTPAELHEHWQGHRRLTRRVIEAFPADQINTFSLGGMRPFGAMVRELLNMAEPSLQGALTDEWRRFTEGELGKAELLERWDESTRRIDELFPQLPDARFRETRNAFGMWVLAVGCGLELSFGQAVGVMGVLAIGILLPAGPGLFGSFQLAVTLALQLFFASEIVNGVGSIYVFLLFVVQAVGIVLAGVVPLLTLKVRLADLMPRLDGLSSEGAR